MALLKVDLGCGPNKREGYQGLDIIKFPGVDIVHDVRKGPLPFKDDSVEEFYSSHFVEHLTAMERVHLMNEVWRCLKPEGKFELKVPDWSSASAYGDPTHQWPPMSPWFFWYLDKGWRAQNAPHTDHAHAPGMYKCDFIFTCVPVGNAAVVQNRPEGWMQYAAQFYINVVAEQHATLTKRVGAGGATPTEGPAPRKSVAKRHAAPRHKPKARGDAVPAPGSRGYCTISK